MTAVAGQYRLGRESLYKAFAPGAKPRHETVIKVLQGLGVRLQVLV
jgi:probable addiction module antidote protein